MNANILYDIYEATRNNQCNDLTVGLAMYKDKNPGTISHEEDKAIREFMGKHGQALAEAFPDKDAFIAVVAIAEDAR